MGYIQHIIALIIYFSHLFPSLFLYLYVQSSGTGSSPDVIWGNANWSQDMSS